MLKQAVYVVRETNGVFDPTIGALTIGVYGFGRGGESEFNHAYEYEAFYQVDKCFLKKG